MSAQREEVIVNAHSIELEHLPPRARDRLFRRGSRRDEFDGLLAHGLLRGVDCAANGGEIKVMAGRYGPYVTDGSTNTTLPKGMEPKDVTLDEAVRLIDERAAKGPAKKKFSRKKAK